MKFKLLSQLALQVKDGQASLDFYCGFLGLEKIFDFCNDTGKPWMHYLRISDYQYLELIPTNSNINNDNASFHHVGLIVEDVYVAAKELLYKGVKLYCGPAAFGKSITKPEDISPGLDNNPSFYLEDPDHNNVEIMQFVENSKQHFYEKKEK